MTTHAWHAEPAVLAAYVGGDLDAITGASVEQHLTRCAECRTAVATHVDPHPLERAWLGIRDAVQSPPLPLLIRLARRCGLSEPTAVLLAATASLRTAWVVSAIVAVAFAGLATVFSGGDLLAPFLLVAPLVPVLGVAAAYGPHQDPLESLAVTTPLGRTRLVLTRALAVLVSVLPFTALLGVLLPGPEWVAAAWLGPALAMVPLLLAISSFAGPRTGAAVLAIGWTGIVLLSLRVVPATWPVQASQQLVYLALAAASVVVLVVRSRQGRQVGAVL